MHLQSFSQVASEEAAGDAALFVAASGYEQRAPHAAEKLQDLRAKRRIALGFMDRRVLAREDNDRRFRRLGFEVMEAEGSEMRPLATLIESTVAASKPGAKLRIVVDYTSMTRMWYAGVLRALAQERLGEVGSVTVDFVYSPSTYSRPHDVPPNESIAPIPGFSSLQLPRTPIALIVGLGYERDRALGLVEYVEPSRVVAFIADPGIDPRFEEDVLANNAMLLARLSSEDIIRYPLMSIETTSRLLTAVSLPLLEDQCRVVVAPLGPKPFTLVALIGALAHRGMDVWRVSAGQRERPYDREPEGSLIVGRAVFVQSSVERRSRALGSDMRSSRRALELFE